MRKPNILLILTLLLTALATPAVAQSDGVPVLPCIDHIAEWCNYGEGWPGTHGVPDLVSQSAPVLGEYICVQVGNSFGKTTDAVLIVGFADADIPTKLGGRLLLVETFCFPLLLGPKGTELKFRIPDDPNLCGMTFYAQTVMHDVGASNGVAFSRGFKATIGGPGPVL